MIENMLELVEKLEVYLLQISVDIRYEEIIKAYFSMFKQKYRNLSLENLIPEIKGETFPLKLYFPDVSGRNQSFECCFLINTLAVKAKKRGKILPILPKFEPYIILNIYNSKHKVPAPNSPIILLLFGEEYLCLDGNHRLLEAFRKGQKSIGYVINHSILDSSDFCSKYDYYNFVLFICYFPLKEAIKMSYSQDLIYDLHLYLSQVDFSLKS